MSLIGKVSAGNYEDKLNIETLKVKENIKKALLHNIWAYLYYNYAGSRLESDKAMTDALRIMSEAFNNRKHYV